MIVWKYFWLVFVLLFGGLSFCAGGEIAGWADGYCVSDDDFSVGLKRFGEQAAKRYVVDGDHVDIELWSRDAEARRFTTGSAKTHEMVVIFAEQGDALGQIQFMNEPLMIQCEPEYYTACGVIVSMPGVDGETSKLDSLLDYEAEAAIDYQRNTNRFYDMVDYGDTGNKVRSKNSEVDMQKGFLINFMRSGGLDSFHYGIDVSRHNMDVDVNHWHDSNYRFVGGHAGHSEDHTGTPRVPYISHTWLEGFLLDYYLTGNKRSYEIAFLSGRGLVHAVNNFGVPCEYGNLTTNSNSRSLGRTLINLSGLYDSTYNRRYVDTMVKIAEQIRLGQRTDGAMADAVTHDGRWGTGYAEGDESPQKASIVLNGLKQFLRENENAAVEESFLSLCDWMIARGSFAMKLGYLYHSDLGARTYQTVNCTTYMIDNLTLAAEISGDRRYLDLARRNLINNYEFWWNWVSGTDLNTARSMLYYFGEKDKLNFPGVAKAYRYDSRKTIDYLRSLQNADGGFGFWPGLMSEPESGYWAIKALDALDSEPVDPAGALGWTNSCRVAADKGYAADPEDNEDVIRTFYCVEAIETLGGVVPWTDELIVWLNDCQNNRVGERGGFGDSPRPVEYYGLDTIPYQHTWESIVLHTTYAVETLEGLGGVVEDPAFCENFLDTYMHSSGGANCGLWSEYYSKPVDPLSTLLLIRAYNSLGVAIDSAWASATIAYLKGLQNADGGFSYEAGQVSTMRHSWICLRALNLLGGQADDSKGLGGWFRRCANFDGGFGNEPGMSSDVISTAHAVDILGVELPGNYFFTDLLLLVEQWLFDDSSEANWYGTGAGDLILLYEFDDVVGLTASDEMGYADGDLKNFAGDDSQWVLGLDGGAVSLDGVNDYIDIDDAKLADFHDKTLCLWFRQER